MNLHRREFLNKAGQVCLGSLLGYRLAAQASSGQDKVNPAVRKPNIVFILIDDWGYTDAGCLGSDFYETPHIDRLRRKGMLFTEHYCPSPVCAPSRASIVTGQYHTRLDNLNTVTFLGSAKADRFPLLEPQPPRELQRTLQTRHISIAKPLRTAGYQTAFIGKWHLDGIDRQGPGPEEHGFDYVVQEKTFHNTSEEIAHYQKAENPDYKFIDYYTRETLKFIEKNKNRPFFVFLSHDAMHHDYFADPKRIARYQAKIKPGLTHSNAVYAANLEHLDEGIGRLVNGIDEMGLDENTLILLASDNGGRTGKVNYEICTSNAPLKHGKHTLYEGGIRVPLIVRWPAQVKPNSICDVPNHGIDFFPTFTELAGAPRDSYGIVDGTSIVPLLMGKGAIKTRPLFWYFPRNMDGPVWWSNKTIAMHVRPSAAVRYGDYKLIYWFESDDYTELYNVKKDISEKTNLAKQMPEKVKELRQLLEGYFKETSAMLPIPNPKYRK